MRSVMHFEPSPTAEDSARQQTHPAINSQIFTAGAVQGGMTRHDVCSRVESNDMDTTLASGEVARQLGVSAPTLRRAAARLGIFHKHIPGQHRRFNDREVRLLVGELGVTPTISGFTPQEVKVLAAFARHPLGFRSIRAVARSAQISPTTASGVVEALVKRGFVSASVETVAEGSARDLIVYRLKLSPEWSRIASVVSQTVPRVTRDRVPSEPRVPQRLWHHFWNVEPSRLRLPDDGEFIARRLLLSQDPIAWAWASRNLSAEAIASTRNVRGVDGATRAMIDNLLAGSTE